MEPNFNTDPHLKYIDATGVKYTSVKTLGYMTIPVLPFLVGKPWDATALDFVHTLRPSFIRVSTGEVTADSKLWRVTVIVTDLTNPIIKRIEQYVETGLTSSMSSRGLLTSVGL